MKKHSQALNGIYYNKIEKVLNHQEFSCLSVQIQHLGKKALDSSKELEGFFIRAAKLLCRDQIACYKVHVSATVHQSDLSGRLVRQKQLLNT